ncbi:MAG: EF-hand domain-containing protein [Deltaproteobacteria bacterium]|nr:EF-hand domain-containing protein [Deltaproteobacteria bacterium]
MKNSAPKNSPNKTPAPPKGKQPPVPVTNAGGGRTLFVVGVIGAAAFTVVLIALVAWWFFSRGPSISDQTRLAFQQYDKNNDGYLDAAELEQCPALKAALKQIDADGDGKISVAELQERMRQHRDSGITIQAVVCRFSMDGRPLVGANVTIVPEALHGTSVKPAIGTTDANGSVSLSIEGGTLPGCQNGFYRVQVSKKDSKGQELLPSKYQENSILGLEVAPDRKEAEQFKVTSK